MPTIEELTWDQILEQVTYIAEDRSSLGAEMRERVMARAILELAERLSARVARRDLIERCPSCGGKGWFSDEPASGRGMGIRNMCARCRERGESLTEAGRAVAEIARAWT